MFLHAFPIQFNWNMKQFLKGRSISNLHYEWTWIFTRGKHLERDQIHIQSEQIRQTVQFSYVKTYSVWKDMYKLHMKSRGYLYFRHNLMQAPSWVICNKLKNEMFFFLLLIAINKWKSCTLHVSFKTFDFASSCNKKYNF